MGKEGAAETRPARPCVRVSKEKDEVSPEMLDDTRNSDRARSRTPNRVNKEKSKERKEADSNKSDR